MAATRRRSPRPRKPGKATRSKTGAKPRRWSHHVTAHSDALDLEKSVFAKGALRKVFGRAEGSKSD